MKRAFSLLFALFTMLFMLSVGISAAENTEPTLNKTSLTVVCGVNYRLKVNNIPANTTVKWSSSDKSVASVTTGGKVLTNSCGTATITAKVDKKTLKCSVKVIAGTIKFSQSSYTVPSSGKTTIYATVKGSKSVGLKNSNQKVASVKIKPWQGDNLPLEIAPVKEGTVTVTVYLTEDRSISKSVKITVKNGAAQVAEETEDTEKEKLLKTMTKAEQILYFVNIEREKAGVAPLELDDTLCSAAKTRALEITDTFSHIRPDGSSCVTLLEGTDFENKYTGENIAAGYNTAEATVAQWMASKGHRKNMLDEKYKYLGAAYKYDKSAPYRYYWVQLFSE